MKPEDNMTATEAGMRVAGVRQVLTVCSRFTLAVMSRYAPHLCPVQAASLRGMDLQAFDDWVQSLDDQPRAELAVWLMDREVQMRDLLVCLEQGKVPAAVEYLKETLAVETRALPLGAVVPFPKSRAYRANSGEDAARRLLGVAQQRPGV